MEKLLRHVDVISNLCFELSISKTQAKKILNTKKECVKWNDLNIDETKYIIRLYDLKNSSILLMGGNKEVAMQWLREPQPFLNNLTPTEASYNEVNHQKIMSLISKQSTITN